MYQINYLNSLPEEAKITAIALSAGDSLSQCILMAVDLSETGLGYPYEKLLKTIRCELKRGNCELLKKLNRRMEYDSTCACVNATTFSHALSELDAKVGIWLQLDKKTQTSLIARMFCHPDFSDVYGSWLGFPGEGKKPSRSDQVSGSNVEGRKRILSSVKVPDNFPAIEKQISRKTLTIKAYGTEKSHFSAFFASETMKGEHGLAVYSDDLKDLLDKLEKMQG